MRTLLCAILLAFPAVAAADSIGPCPPGERVVMNPTSPGAMHHGGFHCESGGPPPPPEPPPVAPPPPPAPPVAPAAPAAAVGCGCSAGAASSGPALLALVPLALAVRWRRRR